MSIRRFQSAFLAGILIAIALVLFGWILVPAERFVPVLAAIAILIIYGAVVWFATPGIEKLNPAILSIAIECGLIAGLIFVSEIILEYVLLPKDNTTFGLIEFGSVFFIYFLSGLITALQTKNIRNGVLSAIWTAMIATLMWAIAVLAMDYLFRGTPQQTKVFQAEGNYADFAQSGMTDFNAFIMEDFMGAVFYHSLLGPMLAALFGLIGGLIGRGISKVRSK